jgi:hypothetical protein
VLSQNYILKELRESTELLKEDSQNPGWDLKRTPLEYNSVVLLPEPDYSVIMIFIALLIQAFIFYKISYNYAKYFSLKFFIYEKNQFWIGLV